MRARHFVMWYRDYRLVRDRDNTTTTQRDPVYAWENGSQRKEGSKEMEGRKEKKERQMRQWIKDLFFSKCLTRINFKKRREKE